MGTNLPIPNHTTRKQDKARSACNMVWYILQVTPIVEGMFAKVYSSSIFNAASNAKIRNFDLPVSERRVKYPFNILVLLYHLHKTDKTSDDINKSPYHCARSTLPKITYCCCVKRIQCLLNLQHNCHIDNYFLIKYLMLPLTTTIT